jgi:thiol-disulfide isomerase/thioredoxin
MCLMKHIILLIICLISATTMLAQELKIYCTIKDQAGNQVVNAEVFKQQFDLPGIFGGQLPPRDELVLYRKLQPGTEQKNGTVLMLVDNRVPHYLFFTAPGKKTYMTFFPYTEKKELYLEITLYDTALIRDESQSVIETNDERINEWLRVAALTNMSAKTPVINQMALKAQYRNMYGTTDGFKSELSSYLETLLSEYNSSTEKQLKNFILLNIAFLCIGDKYPVEAKYLIELIKELPPDDYLWYTAEGDRAQRAIYLRLGRFAENQALLLPFYESLSKSAPVAKRPAQLSRLVHMAMDERLPEASGYYGELVKDYPESNETKSAIAKYGRPSNVKQESILPDFSVLNVDVKETKIDNSTIAGKITLIDFWATWCGPCIAEFNNLEEVYKEYKAKGFEILSISIDTNIELVNKFRTKRYKMPWLNGFAGDALPRMKKDFDLTAVPRLILVDDHGKVLNENRNDLEGDALKETLARVFSIK